MPEGSAEICSMAAGALAKGRVKVINFPHSTAKSGDFTERGFQNITYELQ